MREFGVRSLAAAEDGEHFWKDEQETDDLSLMVRRDMKRKDTRHGMEWNGAQTAKHLHLRGTRNIIKESHDVLNWNMLVKVTYVGLIYCYFAIYKNEEASYEDRIFRI